MNIIHFHLSVILLTHIFVHLLQITAVNMNLQQAEAVAPGVLGMGLTQKWHFRGGYEKEGENLAIYSMATVTRSICQTDLPRDAKRRPRNMLQ